MASKNFIGLARLTEVFTLIKNTLHKVALSGSYNDLDDKPTIPDTSTFVQKSGDTMTGKLTISDGGLLASGRVYGAGDDEGIVVLPAANGYAAIVLGSHNARRFYIVLPNGTSFPQLRYNDGTNDYRLTVPSKSGTIAITSDIPTDTNQLTNGAGFITSSGTAANVSGTVAIANGGTGATTRLNAAKNLTNEAVSSPGYVVGLTSSWGKFGYTTLAELKTAMSLNNVNNTADANKSVASATKATQDGDGSTISSTYLKLSGGTMTGTLTNQNAICLSSTKHLYWGDGTVWISNNSNWWLVIKSNNGNLYQAAYHDFKNAAGSAYVSISSSGATYFYGSTAAGSVTTQSDTITFSEDRGNGFCIRADTGLWIRPRGTGYGFTSCNASAFNVNSSIRYKENVQPLSEEEARKILEVETVTFDYKNKENSDDRSVLNQRGVIAEQVEEIIPSVVTLEKVDGEDVPGYVDYSKFVPYLIKIVQMQQKEIDELKAIVKVTE